MTYSVNFANYTIGKEAYKNVNEVCRQYGTKALLIGGKLALEAGKEKLLQALAEGENPVTIVDTVLFGEDCTYAGMEKIAAHVKKCGLPVFTFPTIAATCAATTALSVVYKEDGNFDSFYFYDKPARHSFIDTEIIAIAPECYLRAGIGDTLGKYFECHFSARGDRLTHSSALGREISNMCYLPLREYAESALEECRENQAGEALEQAVLANIVSTGLVSLLVLDDYNGAIAHSVYYGLVLLPGFEEKNLHGDVVAYGVLVQLMIDGEEEKAREMKGFLEKIGIRTTLAEMGAPLKREALTAVLKEIVTGPDMEHIPYEVTEDMVYDALCKVEEL